MNRERVAALLPTLASSPGWSGSSGRNLLLTSVAVLVIVLMASTLCAMVRRHRARARIWSLIRQRQAAHVWAVRAGPALTVEQARQYVIDYLSH